MNIKINKKKLVLTLGLILIFGGAYEYIYNKLHTNTPDDINDHTGKYIFNPDYKAFHKYDLVDLKSIYPTKLAYEPEWFKLPPDKYIPKEQPIPKQIKNISDPKIRRESYFNFLCKTESVVYRTSNYNSITKIDAINFPEEEGILYLNQYLNIPKISNSNYIEAQLNILSELNSNPFINPIYNSYFYPLIEGHTYNFHGVDLDLNSKSINKPLKKSSNNQFVEFMSPEGKVFKIEYSNNLNKFLPSKIVPYSNSRFYILSKPIERLEMKNLGIHGDEIIVYDRLTNKLMNYSKTFFIGALLSWKDSYAITNFSWLKSEPCENKVNLIEDFI